MKTIILHMPKDLPKSARLCVARTVQPDVQLAPKAWALHHRQVNHKVIVLS